jgi:hypothetical protein
VQSCYFKVVIDRVFPFEMTTETVAQLHTWPVVVLDDMIITEWVSN